MLSYILRIMQEFERMHGQHPQVIYLNSRHMRQLMHECPDLFSEHRPVPLGFRIVELPEEEMPHPKAAWLPPQTPELLRVVKPAKASARAGTSRRKIHAKKQH
ncbi:MAG: hypothetical protein A2W18_01565 [Candidatus Muproteobacteria bacterium RBG_16_60_9]|jgi:hypothetical protein|uniref:Uncharacterized protein n=1 Tax=Candidatus Muproteobacteria bacterium RBG_16_60_9 TaxID=1817755 RepID=A0A1F6V261_9PROT|nr:MAG: hypothetical protein A2W18_01565 [Candidatus Muproteobacteria bacterium RBG_16_60_9]